MKKKLFAKTILLFSILLLLFCSIVKATGNIVEKSVDNSKEQNKLEVKYEYNQEENEVEAKIVSNVKLKNTKPTWKLSDDKLTYTKVFKSNTNYKTLVEDINGKITEISINVTQIKDFKIQVQYEYNSKAGQVTAKIVSNVKLKNTKPSWKLSDDKLTYTKVFTKNTSYTTPVEDMHGNKINANINVNHLRAKINVNYEYNSATNQVTAKIVSDIELKNTKPSWKLSSDKLTYTKVFTSNTNYQTPVQDKYGNTINVTINVTQVKHIKANVNLKYEYNSTTNQVTVKIVSDIELRNTKPSWKLSSDKLTYTKVFTSNTNYQTPVQDKYGNIINVNINVNQIDMQPPEISVDYMFNKDDTVTVSLKSNKKLGNTKPSWSLSSDQLVYKKTFSTGQNYSTPIQDIYGNKTNVKIEFKIQKYTYKQDDNSTIKVRYLYKARTEAIVEIISSVKMVNTKPSWKLSADGYSYTKIFNTNNLYVTPIKDVNGVTKNVNILVNLFDNYLNGIDVSAHQGKINWAEVKNSGINYAIIRCGYGQNIPSQDDVYFARNISECERLGIPYGVYLYSYALTEKDAYSEVDHVLRLIKGHNPKYGIWIDMEDADGYKSRNGMPSNATLVNICDIFCKKMQENGYSAGVYASLNWLDTKLNDSKLDKYNKWVAQWNSSCSYSKKYVMWQYTSKGSVNGILTNVDMDIFYK